MNSWSLRCIGWVVLVQLNQLQLCFLFCHNRHQNILVYRSISKTRRERNKYIHTILSISCIFIHLDVIWISLLIYLLKPNIFSRVFIKWVLTMPYRLYNACDLRVWIVAHKKGDSFVFAAELKIRLQSPLGMRTIFYICEHLPNWVSSYCLYIFSYAFRLISTCKCVCLIWLMSKPMIL